MWTQPAASVRVPDVNFDCCGLLGGALVLSIYLSVVDSEDQRRWPCFVAFVGDVVVSRKIGVFFFGGGGDGC